MLSGLTACATQPVVVNTISKDCLLFRPVYLSETTISTMEETRKQLLAMGSFERAEQIRRDQDAIGDNNEVFEKRCPKSVADE